MSSASVNQQAPSGVRSPPTTSSSLRPSLDSPWDSSQHVSSAAPNSNTPASDEADPVLGPWDPSHAQRREVVPDSSNPSTLSAPSTSATPSAVVLTPPTPFESTSSMGGDSQTSAPVTGNGGIALKPGDFIPPTERPASPSKQGLSKETRPQLQAQTSLPPNSAQPQQLPAAAAAICQTDCDNEQYPVHGLRG